MSDDLTFRTRLKHGWNAFRNKDPVVEKENLSGYASGVSYGPERHFLRLGGDQTIVTSVYNRLATDTVQAKVEHVKVDDNDNFTGTIDSGLNNVLTTEANCDQTGRDFFLDLVLTMLDDGYAAAVPVDTTINPAVSGAYDIQTIRVGSIVGWKPKSVRVDLYNDSTGNHEQIELSKSYVGIVTNPFYSVMNEPNSTMKRLSAKLALLDAIDQQSGSGKLDLIVQLPYTIKSEARMEQAEKRRKQIEEQLLDSKYGIAYTDATEHITQLNRSVENNLMSQIEYLTSMLYSQLGLTAEIMNGTANESTMLNYYKRTINAFLDAITGEFERKFLTKTARSQHQAIKYHRDPFSLTTTESIAEIADKFVRNEILAPNEMRGVVGFKPVDDPKANELRNPNLNEKKAEGGVANPPASTDSIGEG